MGYSKSEKNAQEKKYRKTIQDRLTYKETCVIQCSKQQPRGKSSKKINTFLCKFKGLNELRNMNECDILCSNQLNHDTRQYSKVCIQPKMNVILRKDKTKSNLARHHHRSFFY